MKTIPAVKLFNYSTLISMVIGLVFFLHYQNGIAQNPVKKEVTDNTRLGYPPLWNEVIPTTNAHIMIVMMAANPRINNIPINPGDYIGTFYTDNSGQLKCAGADYWQGDANIVFAVWGDDFSTPEKDGFAYGELINFKIFSWATQKSYDVDLVAFDPEYPYSNWYPLAMSEVINMKCIEVFDAYATANPNPVCLGNSVSLAANIFIGTNGNYTFSWTSNPAGFTSNLQYPTATPQVNTNYLLVASDGSNTSNHQVAVVVNLNPVVNAGSDATICANQTALVSGTVSNYGSFLWSTAGDGSFSNEAVLNPIYIPGTNDKQNGSAVLTLTAQPMQGCTLTASDQMTVTILPLPTVNAGEDKHVCKGSDVLLNASAQNYSSIQWTTGGDGTFSDTHILNPQYFPGTSDLATCNFTLTISVSATTQCSGNANDQIKITLTIPPTAGGPANKTICETSNSVTINGTATNYSSLLWITAGDGTFTNPNILVAVYSPGPNDKLNGGTTVTLNAIPNSPCTVPATKQVSIIIKKLANIDAGTTNKVCQGFSLQLNATASNYNAIFWSSSGNGSFNNTGILTAIYTPGTNDIAAGQFTLTLTGTALFPCTTAVSDNLSVEIVGPPSVQINTPSNQSYCSVPPLQLNASGDDYDYLLWTTSGNGTFSDPSIINPIYTPGTADISGNPILFTLTGYAVVNCTPNSVKQISETFVPGPSANAGTNALICQGSTHQLSGTAQHQSSVTWTTSGSGTFSNANILNPVYTPGTSDITAGTITLTLTASAVSPCTTSASSNKTLTIQKTPTANAGSNATICEGSNHQLSGSAQNYGTIAWTTSGTGTFSNANILNPVYTPSGTDIIAGTVTLTLTASAVSPCTIAGSANKTLVIQKPPTANAGADATILDSQSLSISASAGNYSGLLWQTTGDGSFSNLTILNPVYYPGPTDIQNSTVLLTLSALSNAPCTAAATDALTLTIMRQQFIQLTSGWTSLSSFVLPSDPAFDQVLAPVSNNLIIAKNFLQLYWPEYGINTIGNFNPTNGYLVKMSSASVLPITGFKSQNKTAQLSIGWNILPVISDVNVNTQELITQLANKLIIVTEIAGNGVIWPEEGIYTIPVLIPGKAYYIKVNCACSFTFPN